MSILNIDQNISLVHEELKKYAVIDVSLFGFFKNGTAVFPVDCWYGSFAGMNIKSAIGHVPAEWSKDDIKTAIRECWRHKEKIYFRFTKNNSRTTIYVYVKDKESKVSQCMTVATIKIRLKYDWELKDEYTY